MDHKTWPWKKKSADKAASDKVNEEEAARAQKLVELETSVEDLNQKLSSALSDCKTKDDLAAKQKKELEKTLTGWEQTKEEAASQKLVLDKALQQRVVADERISHLDAALKECMQQLRFVREEQEQRVHDAVMKTTKEHEKVRRVLEEKLAETKKSLSKLTTENTHLNKIIQIKEQLIEDVERRNAQAEADYSALEAKLDSMRKDNASVIYELRMLEKELEIRTEEREFNRRSSDASHKQHLESVKKIAKLETECQKLRLLVRKRLPGPADLARMRSEVDMLGRDQAGATRTRLVPSMGGSMAKEPIQENSPGSPSKKVNYLIERLCDIEEENKTLKEELSKKTSELNASRIMCARTTSKLSEVEAQLAEYSQGKKMRTPSRDFSVSRRLSFTSEDAESWSPSLLAEMENIRNEKPRGSPSCRTVGSSDICLMDDFAEMEKLALVCVNKSPGISSLSPVGSPAVLSLSDAKFGVPSSEAAGKELVLVTDKHSGFSDKDHELPSKVTHEGKYSGLIHDILTFISEQEHLALRNPDEIVKDIKIALGDEKERSRLSNPPKLPDSSGDTYPVSVTKDLSKEASTKHQSGLNQSVRKIVELIERINQQSSKDFSSETLVSEDGSSLSYKNPVTPTGYTYRVFQWKSTELNHILRQFVHTCDDLLNGKAEFENFTVQLTSTFEWIMNHCFSLQDVSSMKEIIKQHFHWDESRSECDHGTGINSFSSDTGKAQATKGPSSEKPQADEMSCDLNEENKRPTALESAKKNLEVRLQSATERIKALLTKLQESEKGMADLQKELDILKASKDMLEEQNENHKLLIEDLNTQLTVVRAELNKSSQKISSLEVELEDKKNSCHELENTYLEQQLQLESMSKNELNKEQRHQNGWEISEASEKLAECQQTILNLGKQLKALASPKEAALLDKVISINPTDAVNSNGHANNHSRRSSLLDQILAENGVESDELESPKMKEIICTTDSQREDTHPPHNPKSLEDYTGPNATSYKGGATAVGALAIVPRKKRGGSLSLLKKLLSVRKKDASRKVSRPRNS